jgi:cytochrome P450
MHSTLESRLQEDLRLIFTGDVDAIQDPYPVYARLLEESPVHRYDASTVIVSRHPDVKATYRDEAHFPATRRLGSPFEGQFNLLGAQELAMLDYFAEFDKHTISRKNGADHTRVRRAAHMYFTPRRVDELRSTFQGIFDELIDEHSTEDIFDFARVAYRLPLLVICEIFGVPREDAEQLKAWGDVWTITGQNPLLPESVHRKAVVLEAYRDYVRQLVARHRGDEGRSRLISSVLDATEEQRLTEDELVAFILHTTFAGHETTQHALGNGLHALLLHRDQWRMLCSDAALVPAAVEEILRFDPPVAAITKYSAEGASVAGVAIEPGKFVMLLDAAANRDPAVFEDPHAFDITRSPNDHVTLGFGPHVCLGASLARLEGRIVFETLSRRFPDLDFAVDHSTLRYHRGMRGLDELPVRLGPRRD